MKHDHDTLVLRQQAAGLGVDLSDEQAATLIDFEALLREHAVPAGLIGHRDAPRLRERHVLDCLRAAGVVDDGDRLACDLGSGAGLPGVIVAVAMPTLRMILVEARQRRAAFLELAVERLGLGNAMVFPDRIEVLAKPRRVPEEFAGSVDLCLARALAPLPRAWRLADPLLRPGGRLVYFGGQGQTASVTVPGAHVLEVRAAVLERTGPLVIMAR